MTETARYISTTSCRTSLVVTLSPKENPSSILLIKKIDKGFLLIIACHFKYIEEVIFFGAKLYMLQRMAAHHKQLIAEQLNITHVPVDRFDLIKKIIVSSLCSVRMVAQ
jgi:hypothetical protein